MVSLRYGTSYEFFDFRILQKLGCSQVAKKYNVIGWNLFSIYKIINNYISKFFIKNFFPNQHCINNTNAWLQNFLVKSETGVVAINCYSDTDRYGTKFDTLLVL